MANPATKDGTLDLQRLAGMVEPLTVRVVKWRGSVPQPLELPAKQNEQGEVFPQGTQYTREEVPATEQLVIEKWGGGSYRGEVVDANGQKLIWIFGIPPAMVPDKMPSDMAARAAMAPGIPTGLSMPLGSMPMGGPQLSYGQSPIGQVQAPAQAAAPAYPNPYFSSGLRSEWGGRESGRDTGAEERIRRLEEMNQREREERLKLEHQYAIERQQQQHASDMQALKDELRRLSEQSTKRPAEDEVTKLRADFERKHAEMMAEAQRKDAERERERSEERHRAEIAALASKLDQFMVSQGQNRADPMLEYLKESTRASSENARAQLELAKSQIINPLQIAELLAKRGDGAQDMIRGLTDSFKNIMDLQNRVVENITNLSGSGQAHPAIEILQEGLARGADLGKQWIQVQRDKAVSETRGKAQEAQANAQAAIATVQAESIKAQVEYIKAGGKLPGQEPQNGKAPGKPAAQPGLNGAQAAPAAPPAAAPSAPAGGAPLTSAEKHDRELWGIAFPEVQKLRMGAATGKVPPEAIVDSIFQGVDVGAKAGIHIPAFDLFAEDRFPELVDLLLPQAPAAYREAVVAAILSRLGEDLTAAKGEADPEEPAEPAEATLEGDDLEPPEDEQTAIAN